MLRSIFIILLLFTFLASSGQKLTVNAPLVATTGNKSAETTKNEPVNISKWRLGEIYLLTLPETALENMADSELKVYPNPFRNQLNLELKTDITADYQLLITDMSGKQQFYNDEKTIVPGQTLQIDLAYLSPAMYVLTLVPADQKSQWMVKIQKQ